MLFFECKACALFSVSRSTLGDASRLEARDGPLLAAMKQLSDPFPRFGYRRILVFMEQLGHALNIGWTLFIGQFVLQVPTENLEGLQKPFPRCLQGLPTTDIGMFH